MSESENKPEFKPDILFWIFSLCLIGILLVAVMPYFIRTHFPSAANGCLNNLRQIDAAAHQFALENHKTNGEAIKYPDDLTPYVKLNSQGKIPECPGGGIYIIKKIGDTPICSLGTTVTPAHVLP